MAASTTLTPEQRIARARKAGQAAQSVETYARKVIRDLTSGKPLDVNVRRELQEALEAAAR